MGSLAPDDDWRATAGCCGGGEVGSRRRASEDMGTGAMYAAGGGAPRLARAEERRRRGSACARARARGRGVGVGMGVGVLVGVGVGIAHAEL